MDDRLFSVGCPRCDHRSEVDPGEKPKVLERFWCAECGQDLGDWRAIIHQANAPLAEILARRA